MAVVRCPCGATHEVPDASVGQLVTCPACKDLFMPRAVGGEPSAPASAPKRLIGEIAVDLGLVSREHLDLCVEYQEALRSASGAPTKRLGEILVEKGLLKPSQVDALLQEQRGDLPKRRPAPARLVSMADVAREMVKPAQPERKRARAPIPRWAGYLVLILLVAGGVIAAVALWPASAAERTLDTYLRGCSENAAEKADYLAARDLGLLVREFRIEALAPAVRHDYTSDLAVFASHHDRGTWAEFCQTAEMSAEKHHALELILPCLPQTLTPQGTGSLTVTVQPAIVLLTHKPKGERRFPQERRRFLLIRIDSPRWSVGWRVAACEPLEGK